MTIIAAPVRMRVGNLRQPLDGDLGQACSYAAKRAVRLGGPAATACAQPPPACRHRPDVWGLLRANDAGYLGRSVIQGSGIGSIIYIYYVSVVGGCIL